VNVNYRLHDKTPSSDFLYQFRSLSVQPIEVSFPSLVGSFFT
jgi:hypothetical protein